MTPRLARNQLALRRRNAFKRERIYLRRSVGPKKYFKKLLRGGRVISQSISAAPSNSWICISPSWTDMKIERTTSEICAAEFASWTIFTEDLGNDDFLGECMRLYGLWTWSGLEEATETTSSTSIWEGDCCCVCCCECDIPCNQDEEEQDTELSADETTTDEDDEDVEELEVEPETPNTCMVVAIPSTKGLLPDPSAGLVRALACPDLLMASLAVLLFETRHLHYINYLQTLPSPPQWMLALEEAKEMDPPNSLVSTVSLPSGWDAVSARLSSSSIFNLFSDRAASPMPSLFSIDPTGVPSTGSTVSVPSSFWDTPSTVSVTGPALTSAVSIPSTFFDPRPLTSTTSSLFVDPSEESSSISTLFMDPSSVHSSCTGCTSSSSLPTQSLSSSSLSSSLSSSSLSSSSLSSSSLSSSSLSSSSISSLCPDCQRVHSYVRSNFDDESTTDEFERSHHTYIVSSSDSDYESEESEYVTSELRKTTVSTQTDADKSATARMMAECDEMLEKLVEMKKKLRELL